MYEANLKETLAAKLAMEIAYALVGSTSIIQLTASLYDQKLKEARFVDGTEGAPQRIEASEFIEARL